MASECDEGGSGHGLGGYTVLGLFGVSQNDASFQCCRLCDNEQNNLSEQAYPDPGTLLEPSALHLADNRSRVSVGCFVANLQGLAPTVTAGATAGAAAARQRRTN